MMNFAGRPPRSRPNKRMGRSEPSSRFLKRWDSKREVLYQQRGILHSKMMDFALKLMEFAFKNDEFCIQK